MSNEVMQNEKVEDIPVKRNIRIKLEGTEPSGYPILVLKDQMTKLGLTCGETSLSKLEEYKEEVMRQFPNGKRQVYYIGKGIMDSAPDLRIVKESGGGIWNEVQMLEKLGVYTEKVNGSWIIDDDAGGYRTELCTLVYEENFDKLYSDYQGVFTGTKSTEEKVINEPTGKAIRDTFSAVANSVCETVRSGIAPKDLESIVSCIIGDNTSENPRDYEQSNVLYNYMVNGYDVKTETANAVGVLAITYKIHIKNYLEKSDNKEGRYNDAEISATARFISYSEIKDMERDLKYLADEGNEKKWKNDVPIHNKKVVVHAEKPNPNKEVFDTGVPIVAPGAYADSMIFYCPDFENVGYIDNTESDVTTTYSRSVSVGFSHSSEFAISAEISMELECEIVKFGVKMGVSMSMTEEWNKSQEETISFDVGAGKEAYLYQGKLRSIILRYDPAKREYHYVESSLNAFLTTSVKTTRNPIKQK